jgi:hypothetical protein
MALKWISNTIFISKIKDAGPIHRLLLELIELIRSQEEQYFAVRKSMDLEFLHLTVCYSEKEFQVIFHILSSDSIIDAVSSYLSASYHTLNIKCVEINSDADIVNLLVHEKGQLQSEKTVPKGLSKHLVEDLEKMPMHGRCYSFTVPELYNQSQSDFIARLSDLKYNKRPEELLDPEDDIAF